MRFPAHVLRNRWGQVSDLANFYHKSVGANAHLEIDFAIDRTGNVAPDHAARYHEFGDWIAACYSKRPLATAVLAAGVDSVELALPPGAMPDRLVLAEDQSAGQFVISYLAEVRSIADGWRLFSSGTTIGSKRIDVLMPAPATALRLNITAVFAPGHRGVSVMVLDGTGCSVS